jgi:hypothetical protein
MASPELLGNVSELGIAKPDLYAKLLGGQALEAIIEDNPNILKGND